MKLRNRRSYEKKILISIICIVLIIAIILFLTFIKTDELSKTKKIIVNEITTGDPIKNPKKEKDITNKKDIDNIIEIISNYKESESEEIITYEGLPEYRLKLLDKKNKIIASIAFYYYEENKGYISFDSDKKMHKIDAEDLLEIIEFKEE